MHDLTTVPEWPVAKVLSVEVRYNAWLQKKVLINLNV